MSAMIKLHLPVATRQSPAVTLSQVQALPGLSDLALDSSFGVVCIDPRAALYVVRADNVDDLERRRRLSPEILEAYGDIRISTT